MAASSTPPTAAGPLATRRAARPRARPPSSCGPGMAMVPTVSPRSGGAEAVAFQPDGDVAVVDAHTGATHWTGTLGPSASLPPTVTDTTIFALADDGTLSAFPVGGCG